MASTIKGLTDEQAAVLGDLQIGDLLLIQKVERYNDNSDEDDDEDEYNEDDDGPNEDDEAEDSDQSDDGDDEGESGAESGSGSGSESEPSILDGDSETDEQPGSDATSATEIPVLPRVYSISTITKDASGNITDVELVHLQYSSTVATEHSYQIYGKQVVHDHSTTCGQAGKECNTAKIADVVDHHDYQIHAKPDGDFVRRLDHDIWIANPHTRCIAGCMSGFLPHGHNLQVSQRLGQDETRNKLTLSRRP